MTNKQKETEQICVHLFLNKVLKNFIWDQIKTILKALRETTTEKKRFDIIMLILI